MTIPGDSAPPCPRNDKPLPRCLTRFLEPAGIDAGYVAQSAMLVPAAGVRTYARALAAIWLDLDRLAQLTPLPRVGRVT